MQWPSICAAPALQGSLRPSILGRMFIQGAGRAAQTYDAIVVGSGISGGWAAKELTEKGLRTLVLERGRDVKHGDYPTEHRPAWDFPLRERRLTPQQEPKHPIQGDCSAFREAT